MVCNWDFKCIMDLEAVALQLFVSIAVCISCFFPKFSAIAAAQIKLSSRDLNYIKKRNLHEHKYTHIYSWLLSHLKEI